MAALYINPSIVENMTTDTGRTLSWLSGEDNVMLVFLRHFGCIFCRESLQDIAGLREQIEGTGTNIVFVHMSENRIADEYFKQYKLNGVEHISDVNCTFYAAFGLIKGSMNQLFGLQTWRSGFRNMAAHGSNYGKQLGDSFQMPGIFIIRNSEIIDYFIHRYVSDRPDYLAMAKSKHEIRST